MLYRNVRGIGIALCLLTLFLFLSGCGSLKDDTLLIVNAVITEIDTAKQTITVKDDADESTLGEECLLDCSCIRQELLDEPLLSTTVLGHRDRTGAPEVGHPAHQRYIVETDFFETCSTSYANSMAPWIIL